MGRVTHLGTDRQVELRFTGVSGTETVRVIFTPLRMKNVVDE
jgi:hypothetical protein